MRTCATTLEAELTQKELNLLLNTLKQKSYTGKHLEIGTAAGGTLWQMISSFDLETRPPFVVVDPMKYFPDQFHLVKENLKIHGIDPNEVNFLIKTSQEAFKEVRNNQETFDFIFVDGAHKIRYVTEDLKWTRLLNVGGTVAFHDYSPKYPGVFLSLNRFLRKNLNYQIVKRVDNLLIVKKTAESHKKEIDKSDMAYAMAWAPLLQIAGSAKKRIHRLKK